MSCARNIFGAEINPDVCLKVSYVDGNWSQGFGETASCFRHFTKDKTFFRYIAP